MLLFRCLGLAVFGIAGSLTKDINRSDLATSAAGV
jgi:hypothetical protein